MLLTGSYIHFPTHHFGESSRLVFGGSKKNRGCQLHSDVSSPTRSLPRRLGGERWRGGTSGKWRIKKTEYFVTCFKPRPKKGFIWYVWNQLCLVIFSGKQRIPHTELPSLKLTFSPLKIHGKGGRSPFLLGNRVTFQGLLLLNLGGVMEVWFRWFFRISNYWWFLGEPAVNPGGLKKKLHVDV